jgi:O-antigen/teichoic acid export membrane protein
VKQNLTVLLLAQVWNQALTALAGLLIIQALEPAEYGRYTLAVVGLNLGLIISDAGLASYLNREAARTSRAFSTRLWWAALRLRLGLALPVWLGTFGLTWLFPVLGQPNLAALASLALFPAGAVALTTALLNGQGRIRLNVLLNGVAVSVNFSLTVLVLLWQAAAVPLLVANLLVALINMALLIYPVFKSSLVNQNEAEEFNYSAVKLLRAGSDFWLTGLTSLVFQYADVYLVSLLLTKEEVGQYGAALRLLALATLVPTVWGIAAMPHFARQPQECQSELVRWGLALTTGGIVIGLAGIFFSQPLVGLLLGSKYSAVPAILGLLGWAAAGIFASTVPVIWLTITNRQHYVVLALVIADLAGLGLNIFLTGLLKWGLEGTAVARIAVSWLLCGLYLAFSRFKTG